MLSSCLRDFPPSRRSPLCLLDSARQFDRTPLVWLIAPVASVSQLPDEGVSATVAQPPPRERSPQSFG